MKIRWYLLLDSLQSLWNRTGKESRERRRWGAQWRDMTRSGRRYSRVEAIASQPLSSPWPEPRLVIRREPGWEWTCQNCKTYSLVTKSMMPDIIAAWAADAQRMTAIAAAKGVQYKVPAKPTAATAGCTNCKFRPGAPE